MNCLCCGKVLKKDNNKTYWHKKCIKNFFGTSKLPEININDETLKKITNESVNNGFTVPGVQKKLSLHLINNNSNSKLTLDNYQAEYILKPQAPGFKSLPESEHLIMLMAESANISTVPHALIIENKEIAYITKRIDRIYEDGRTKKLAMEDFCQLSLRLTEDKYRGSYEQCAKIITKYSSRIDIDMSEFFVRLVFSFIIGNSDMHLKNFSLIETKEGSGEYILSPAYDLLPVNAIMPLNKEQFALAMNGKKRNITKNDFLKFANSCNISHLAAEKMIKNLVKLTPLWIDMCDNSLLDDELKNRIKNIIIQRTKILI